MKRTASSRLRTTTLPFRVRGGSNLNSGIGALPTSTSLYAELKGIRAPLAFVSTCVVNATALPKRRQTIAT
jgi:hypothetical protein